MVAGAMMQDLPSLFARERAGNECVKLIRDAQIQRAKRTIPRIMHGIQRPLIYTKYFINRDFY
jgi:hypothetical protein